ncbi:MAG: hypothetical protein M0R38_12225 [Bacteroidia bacterium]|nr:hypothetical protein [Bacteroidia bacterium]
MKTKIDNYKKYIEARNFNPTTVNQVLNIIRIEIQGISEDMNQWMFRDCQDRLVNIMVKLEDDISETAE